MKRLASSPNSLEKALKILLAFRVPRPAWGVRELSSHLGFSPATVQRSLQTLKNYGFVSQDPKTRQYRLGHIYFQFLDVLQNSYPVEKAALPLMEQLHGRTQETVHLNVVDGVERICIHRLESTLPLKASMPIGNRSPLYAGASSKCLLAFSSPDFIESYLRQVNLVPLTADTTTEMDGLGAEIALTKKRGYARSLGERTPGLGSLSAPILGYDGMVLAAVSLAIPELRFTSRRHRQACTRELIQAARTCSRAMGYGG